jgi:hypothetical protein
MLVVVLLALQTLVLPPAALNAWLPQSQRETEGESPPSEETSKATDPHALVASASARARRVQADRLARLEYHQAHVVQAQIVARYRPAICGEQAGRNGGGCLLRC